MKKFAFIFLLSLCLGFAFSCSESKEHPWNPEWDKKDSTVTPVTPTDPTDPTDPSGEKIVGKPRYVWIDASANFNTFANNKANITEELTKLKNCGFTDVIVDVRPTIGDVLYKSKVATELTKVDAWVGSQYKWLTRTATWDYLQAFIDEGHKVGLRVNAAINTFVGGCLCSYGLGSAGMLFRESSKKSWASVVNTSDGLTNVMDLSDAGSKFLSPANDEVQEYILSIISEIAAYDVDGIVLDRCRFDDYGLQSDFSDAARTKFEAYLGKSVSSWPVFSAGQTSLPSVMTSVQKSWMSFRVKTIHDFVEKAANTVHAIKPNLRFGVYVGAWYSTYYTSGVNWASPRFNVKTMYSWADSDYKNYGYADHCDFMFLGAYASTSSIYGNGEWTMQGFCKQGRTLISGDSVFSGGPDIGNSTGWIDGGQDDKIPDAIDACINASDGFFVFDLCHIRMNDYWDAFKKGFDQYLATVSE